MAYIHSFYLDSICKLFPKHNINNANIVLVSPIKLKSLTEIRTDMTISWQIKYLVKLYKTYRNTKVALYIRSRKSRKFRFTLSSNHPHSPSTCVRSLPSFRRWCRAIFMFQSYGPHWKSAKSNKVMICTFWNLINPSKINSLRRNINSLTYFKSLKRLS